VALIAIMLSTFAALSAGLAQNLSAQLPGQSFAVTADSTRITVGDSVSVRFRIRLHERDQLLDSVPQVAGDLPPGVRVLSIEKLRRSDARVYEGSARIAFYRPGRRPVPIFGVPFMRVIAAVSRATLPSDSAFVLVTPVLPTAGNPPLKDIRELEKRPLSPWTWPAILLALFAAGWLIHRRRHRRIDRGATVEPETVDVPAPQPTAYDIASARLRQVEGAFARSRRAPLRSCRSDPASVPGGRAWGRCPRTDHRGAGLGAAAQARQGWATRRVPRGVD
jgi:hypothetical protein